MIDVNEYLLGANPRAMEHRARTTTKNTLPEREREAQPLREYHVVLHVVVHAEDRSHALEQASTMFDDNAVVALAEDCDEVLDYYKGTE